ncbi:hypothetical protein Goshw_028667, partial [Gossypium schwendimanii]|nr:hypothetical protein [Gossypium schwendimanii]
MADLVAKIEVSELLRFHLLEEPSSI